MIQDTRIAPLNDAPHRPAGRFVLYWMQQSQRVVCNHALEYAVRTANGLKLPVVVVFGLTADYPEANPRHYVFMLEGLQDVAARLAGRGIKFVLRRGSPPDVALTAGSEAAVIVCDRGCLRHQRRQVAIHAGCRVVQVESDLIVPVTVVSEKAEYAARTIRPKIHRHLETYLKPLAARRLKHPSLDMDLDGLDPADTDKVLAPLAIDRKVPPVTAWLPGAPHRPFGASKAFLKTACPFTGPTATGPRPTTPRP